jgi:hypothetical protein
MTDDLTGVWDGTYVQPQVGIVTFTFSGTFLMVRSAKPAQSVATEERTKEPVR